MTMTSMSVVHRAGISTVSSTTAASKYTRYVLALQYNGSNFYGCSYQPESTGYRTVEGDIRTAIAKTCVNFQNVQISSRTDRGVHALCNTMHVDIASCSETAYEFEKDPNRLRRAINFYLNKPCDHRTKREHGLARRYHENKDLRVINADLAPKEHAYPKHNYEIYPWHARHTALKRTYEYRIVITTLGQHADGLWLPFIHDRAWIINDHRNMMNLSKLQEASECLIGTHDFSSFRSKGCSRSSPVTTLYDFEIREKPYLGYDSKLLTIRISGRSFLYKQVRNMIGSLIMGVGLGKLDVVGFREILESRKRTSGSFYCAPAHGLYLVNVNHDGFTFDHQIM